MFELSLGMGFSIDTKVFSPSSHVYCPELFSTCRLLVRVR